MADTRKPITFVKDPDDILDYQVDWAGFLTEGDTLTASTFTAEPDGVTVDSSSFTDTATKARVSGGTVGAKAKVVNHITMASGQEADQTLIFNIKEL